MEVMGYKEKGFKTNLSLVIGNIKTRNVPFGGISRPLKYYFGKFYNLKKVLNISTICLSRILTEFLNLLISRYVCVLLLPEKWKTSTEQK
jgi:hypothetical protein